MTICTVTGTLHDLEGNLLTSTQITFWRAGVYAQDGVTTVPRKAVAVSNGSGVITVDLYAGTYTAETIGLDNNLVRFTVGVPDAASATLSDLIDQIPEIETPAALSSALVHLGSLTASASTELDFTGFDHTTYAGFELHFTDLLPSIDDAELRLRFYHGGAWETGSVYHYVHRTIGNRISGGDVADTSAWRTLSYSKLADVSNDATTGGATGLIRYNANSAASLQGRKVHTETEFIRNTQDYYMRWGVNLMSGVSAQIDGFRLYYDSGNIVSGEAHLYGRRR